MAPVIHALKNRSHHVHVLHAGPQNMAPLDLYDFFQIAPDARISLLHQTPRLPLMTAELMTRLDTYLRHLAPDVVMVHGDSTCALSGTLTASYQDLPVAHLEAGSRSKGQDAFPQDMNSRLIDRMAYWHFATTAQAHRNLLAEGIPACHIHETGHTVIDAAVWARSRMGHDGARCLIPARVQRFFRQHVHAQLLLVSVHQKEHWGHPARRMAAAVAGLLQMHPQLTVVWPLPTGPHLKTDVEMGLACLPKEARLRVLLTDELPFPVAIALLEKCSIVLTDSDHLQLEASALQKPVMILHEDAEELPLVKAGGAIAVGHMARRIVEIGGELLCDPMLLASMQLPALPFGDGLAGQRIADTLSAETEPLKMNRQWVA